MLRFGGMAAGVFVVFAGCAAVLAAPETDRGWLDADLEAEGSMEQLNRAGAARETMPGKPLFEEACAFCHAGQVAKAPHESMLSMMTPEVLLFSMTDGVMKDEAAALTDDERVLIAEYLAGAEMGGVPTDLAPRCMGAPARFDHDRPPFSPYWGITPANTRFIPAEKAQLTAADLPNLKLKWAFAYPGANRARSQPSLAGGAVHVGSHSGKVYALDEETGCIRWTFQASGEVRTGIVIDPWEPGDQTARPRGYFGDILGNVYAIDLIDGTLIWRDRADDHANTTITATPTLVEGRLIVAVSALETGPPTDPAYECCTFRGSIIAYDAATGARAWQTFTIDEPLVLQGQNRSGTDQYGPAGATVWNTPAIDLKRRQLYFGTGQNLSSPATLTSDAIFAIDLDDGAVNWTFQGTPNDAWNGACDTVNDDNCPVENGPDFDFGAAAILAQDADGRDVVLGGQKSGVVHALDPETGVVLWQNQVGRGGIQGGIHFGMAAGDGTVFVPINDMPDGRTYDQEARPGLYAVDIKTGQYKWQAPAPDDVCGERDFCHPGISGAITALPGLVMAGAMDGVLRIHDADTGGVLWQYDTTQPVETVSGDMAQGGSMSGGSGPVAANGRLFVNSGYGLYFKMPGNVLLVFEVQD